MRLTLVCVIAAKLPIVSEAMATPATSICQSRRTGQKTVSSSRSSSAKLAVLRRHADIGRDRRWSAFVHVRSPLVERHRGDLEEQSGDDRNQRQEHQQVAMPARFDRELDHVQIGPRRQGTVKAR